VDLREELKAGNRSIFSRSLARGIREALEAKEQVMLFLNRRGTASFVQCRDCGYVPECRSCSVAMTYHEPEMALICHYCRRRQPLPLGVQCAKASASGRWDRDRTVEEKRRRVPGRGRSAGTGT
jgi:primosomal protein N' (replication factor Y)